MLFNRYLNLTLMIEWPRTWLFLRDRYLKQNSHGKASFTLLAVMSRNHVRKLMLMSDLSAGAGVRNLRLYSYFLKRVAAEAERKLSQSDLDTELLLISRIMFHC